MSRHTGPEVGVQIRGDGGGGMALRCAGLDPARFAQLAAHAVGRCGRLWRIHDGGARQVAQFNTGQLATQLLLALDAAGYAVELVDERNALRLTTPEVVYVLEGGGGEVQAIVQRREPPYGAGVEWRGDLAEMAARYTSARARRGHLRLVGGDRRAS